MAGKPAEQLQNLLASEADEMHKLAMTTKLARFEEMHDAEQALREIEEAIEEAKGKQNQLRQKRDKMKDLENKVTPEY